MWCNKGSRCDKCVRWAICIFMMCGIVQIITAILKFSQAAAIPDKEIFDVIAGKLVDDLVKDGADPNSDKEPSKQLFEAIGMVLACITVFGLLCACTTLGYVFCCPKCCGGCCKNLFVTISGFIFLVLAILQIILGYALAYIPGQFDQEYVEKNCAGTEGNAELDIVLAKIDIEPLFQTLRDADDVYAKNINYNMCTDTCVCPGVPTDEHYLQYKDIPEEEYAKYDRTFLGFTGKIEFDMRRLMSKLPPSAYECIDEPNACFTPNEWCLQDIQCQEDGIDAYCQKYQADECCDTHLSWTQPYAAQYKHCDQLLQHIENPKSVEQDRAKDMNQTDESQAMSSRRQLKQKTRPMFWSFNPKTDQPKQTLVNLESDTMISCFDNIPKIFAAFVEEQQSMKEEELIEELMEQGLSEEQAVAEAEDQLNSDEVKEEMEKVKEEFELNSKKVEEGKPEEDILKIINFIEARYSCSGLCRPSMFYLTEPVTKGPPTQACAPPFLEEVGKIFLDLGNTLITAGVFFLLMICFSCPMCCYKKDVQDDQVQVIQMADQSQQNAPYAAQKDDSVSAPIMQVN